MHYFEIVEHVVIEGKIKSGVIYTLEPALARKGVYVIIKRLKKRRRKLLKQNRRKLRKLIKKINRQLSPNYPFQTI